MYIAWTTVASQAEAEALASSVISHRLAACVQIDGPIVSLYRWQDKIERATEFRLTLKCTASQLPDLERHVLAHHPYETPEWITVQAHRVGEKYLSWADTNSTTPPL